MSHEKKVTSGIFVKVKILKKIPQQLPSAELNLDFCSLSQKFWLNNLIMVNVDKKIRRKEICWWYSSDPFRKRKVGHKNHLICFRVINIMFALYWKDFRNGMEIYPV